MMIRLLYLLIAIFSWFLSGFGWKYRKKVIVLCYHGVKGCQKKFFYSQIFSIASRIILIPSQVNKQKKNSFLPLIGLTFDDAFENLISNVMPVLIEFDTPAIFFAVTGHLGHKPGWEISLSHPEANETIMSDSQLVELSKNKLLKIGSHTVTHPSLISISAEELHHELFVSKKKLEFLLGYPIEDIALPHGAFNTSVIEIATQCGYKRIFSLEPKLIDQEFSDFVIGRFLMSPDVWKIEFFLTCAGAYIWLAPLRKLINHIRNIQ